MAIRKRSLDLSSHISGEISAIPPAQAAPTPVEDRNSPRSFEQAAVPYTQGVSPVPPRPVSKGQGVFCLFGFFGCLFCAFGLMVAGAPRIVFVPALGFSIFLLGKSVQAFGKLFGYGVAAFFAGNGIVLYLYTLKTSTLPRFLARFEEFLFAGPVLGVGLIIISILFAFATFLVTSKQQQE